MKHTLMKRIFSILMVLAMLVSLFPSIQAAADDGKIRLQATEPSVTPDLSDRLAQLRTDGSFDPNEIVRVSIVLEEKSTLQAGFSTMNIASNAQAMAYNKNLMKRQESIEETISVQALGGQALDVVWNLTLVGNIISANVPYGKIPAIEKVAGVAGVVLENTYEPSQASTENAVNPLQYTASGMTGFGQVWTNGYTGAGSRIAIIDTGTDTDHQSFNNGAFLYALEQNAQAAGMTFEEYVASLDLLDVEEIAGVLTDLNIYERENSLTAESLFLTEKLAFAVNYVDGGLDTLYVTHDYDMSSNHGSHVAGISTANRYIPKGDGYVEAMNSIGVAGVAPDAQLITMKVFGKSAVRDSDYMAAIEDAILLGCDSVNLSLGTPSAGFAYNDFYAELLKFVGNSDTVVVSSAGNEGHWADMTAPGAPYSDDVAFATNSSPGTYTNFLTVASVDNDGMFGLCFNIAGHNAMYYENTDYGNLPFGSLDTSADGTGTSYEYIMIDGAGYDSDYGDLDLTGKVVLCSRGTFNFADKAMIAGVRGAAAVIIYNNMPGAFGMDLTGYALTTPCVSIPQEDAQVIRTLSTPLTSEGGVHYYTGTIEVYASPRAMSYNSAYYTMSEFSSWGIPGNLSLKPEITAPGGMIYSVDGSTPENFGTNKYALMSGTSMAAPQVAGMVALVAQHLRESGLAETLNISPRVLAQSLLMSTAVPMLEGSSQSYYSLLQQGAGLARVDLAVGANSYIMVDGQPDGKVKAELGDDPARTGVYTFSFTIRNITDAAQNYALNADLFRQHLYESEGFLLQAKTTEALASTALFAVDGTALDNNQVSVPANSSVTVEVELKLDDETKQLLDEENGKGAYIQAYVFAEEIVEGEAQGTNHSIPVLAFYGNWTDPNMFDRGTVAEFASNATDVPPYLSHIMPAGSGNYLTISYAGDSREYYFAGNPIADDDAYLPQRNGFNNAGGDYLVAQYYTLIRNAGYAQLQIVNKETGEVYYQDSDNNMLPAYFYSSTGSWQNAQDWANLFWYGTDAEGNPLPEGTVVEVILQAVPEYYRNEDGTYDLTSVGSGTTLVTEITIDNTDPTLFDYELDLENGVILNVSAQDNQYVAAAALMNATGSVTLAAASPNQLTANEEVEIALDLSEVSGEDFLLVVYDYAMNSTVYEVTLELPEIERPYFTAVDYNKGTYFGLNEDGSYVPLGQSDRDTAPQAAEFVHGYVFEVAEGGKLYVGKDSDLNTFQYLGELDPYNEWEITNFLDLAFNYADGQLYGMFYCNWNGEASPIICQIDMFTGEMIPLIEMPIDVNNMTIDDEGYFYSVAYNSPSLYKYTLEGAANWEMEYIGEIGYYANSSLNSLAWDHDNDTLYWAYPSTLLHVDPVTAEPTVLSYFYLILVGLYIRPETYDETFFAPVDEVMSVQLSATSDRLKVGASLQLTAKVNPWNISDDSVTWSSADEAIATVDQNGRVTGVSVGTTTITATSNLDPTMSASCTVEIMNIEKTLNGLVWDPEGNIWWSEFDINDLPNYTVIHDTAVDVPLAALAFTPDGTLYAATSDLSSGALRSSLYTVDPETFALSYIGTSEYGYTDIAYAPNLRGGTIMGTYGSSLFVVDPTTGEQIGDYTMFGNGLTAITYAGSDRYQDYGFDTYIDWMYLIDTQGYVYHMGFLADDTGKLYFLEHPNSQDGVVTILDFTTDVPYYSSAHFDGEFLYYSVYHQSKDVSTLIVMDALGDSHNAYVMGNFGPGVWPVGGLCELGPTGGNDPIPEDASIEIGSVTAQAGETFTMEVVLKNNPGLMGLQLLLDYDHSALTLLSAVNGQLLDDLDYSERTNRLQWTADAQTTEDGVLCVLTFQVAQGAEVGEYPVRLTVERALNEAYQDVPVEITDATVQVVSFIYGDVNDDGVVDIVDILMLRKYLANLDPVTGESSEVIGAGADANADGVVDLQDVLMLRQYVVDLDPVTGESSVVLGPQN